MLGRVGRDHLRAQAKSRLSSCRWHAARDVSELEKQNDDIPQAASENRGIAPSIGRQHQRAQETSMAHDRSNVAPLGGGI